MGLQTIILSAKTCFTHSNLQLIYGFFDLLNLTLVISFLIVPYWFYNAGLLFSCASLSLCIVLCLIASLWVLEVLARASLLFRFQECDIGQELIMPAISLKRKFEFNELSKIVIGRIANFVFSLFIILTSLIFIFASIISGSQALSVNFPIHTTHFSTCNSSEFDTGFLPKGKCLNWYRLAVGIFGIIGTVLACLRGNNQKYIIVALSVIRLVVMSYMMCFSIYIIGNGASQNLTISTNFITKFEFDKAMLATGAFFMFISLPSLIPSVTHPIPNKSQLSQMFVVAFGFMGIFLIIYGSILSIAFGPKIHPNSILNLQPYTMDGYNSFIKVLSHIIILYPCLDGISGLIYGVILASNQTFSIVTGKDLSDISIKKNYQILNFLIYFSYSIIPTIFCLFISNFVTLVGITGPLTFIINFIFSAILQIISSRKSNKLFPEEAPSVMEKRSILKSIKNLLFKPSFPTSYSSWYSSYAMVIIISTIATVFFAISFYFLLATFNI